jgi:hypothetical protein
MNCSFTPVFLMALGVGEGIGAELPEPIGAEVAVKIGIGELIGLLSTDNSGIAEVPSEETGGKVAVTVPEPLATAAGLGVASCADASGANAQIMEAPRTERRRFWNRIVG